VEMGKSSYHAGKKPLLGSKGIKMKGETGGGEAHPFGTEKIVATGFHHFEGGGNLDGTRKVKLMHPGCHLMSW